MDTEIGPVHPRKCGVPAVSVETAPSADDAQVPKHTANNVTSSKSLVM